jgi:hypothetical protein
LISYGAEIIYPRGALKSLYSFYSIYPLLKKKNYMTKDSERPKSKIEKFHKNNTKAYAATTKPHQERPCIKIPQQKKIT